MNKCTNYGHNGSKAECSDYYTCCDCGDSDNGCGCAYCWSCNACEECLNDAEDTQPQDTQPQNKEK